MCRLCAWMHQWHPLIVPEWKAEAHKDSDTADTGAASHRIRW